MLQNMAYRRELLILHSTLVKLAALDPNEDIEKIYKTAQNLVRFGLEYYYDQLEKQKIYAAFEHLKNIEKINLPHVAQILFKLRNYKSPKAYFEKRIIKDYSPLYSKQNILNAAKITNSEIIEIAQNKEKNSIEFNNKDFSNVYLSNIKMLFDSLGKLTNQGTYIYNHKKIKFSHCTFLNLNLSKMRFLSDISFENCLFNGNTDFRNSVFEENVSFQYSNFNGTTHFEDTNFLKNANFEHIESRGYAFLFNQYDLDNSENNDRFKYLWSFKGAKFHSQAVFFRRVFPVRSDFSYVSFYNTFYFTNCKFPLKTTAKGLNFFPQNISDFEISIRTLRAALEECYCHEANDELLMWEQRATELKTQTIVDDEKEELLSARKTAAILGYSEASLRTMRSQYPDKIKFVKRANRVFYYKSSVYDFLKLTPPKSK